VVLDARLTWHSRSTGPKERSPIYYPDAIRTAEDRAAGRDVGGRVSQFEAFGHNTTSVSLARLIDHIGVGCEIERDGPHTQP
jgi:hypothetical protein